MILWIGNLGMAERGVLLLVSPGLTSPSAVHGQHGWGLAGLGWPQLGWLLSASRVPCPPVG